ncbi:uncharacterized protein VTP21DRAFT_4553 [Calcarisporiella thermophila]|uniref:uncharacterized protein n=1 Tax=Calcarisporiella thermophila TaxID=911321 RepID=UPI003741FB8C
MGQSLGREKSDKLIDGGSLFPHGVYPGPPTYDYRVVRKLIQERRLAPFYKGLPDLEQLERADLHKDCRSRFPELMERVLYKEAVECPICFLYYPPNLNKSRCCGQPICTECFVQIKRGQDGSPASCPFCVVENFGVCYQSPDLPALVQAYQSGKSVLKACDGKWKSVDPASPEVITTDQIRPETHEHLFNRTSRGSRSRSGSASSHTSPLHVVSLRAGHSDRRTSRSNSSAAADSRYLSAMRNAGVDLEELMVMEAIRLSLLEMEQREHQGQVEQQTPPTPRESPPLVQSPVAEDDSAAAVAAAAAAVATTTTSVIGVAEAISIPGTTESHRIQAQEDQVYSYSSPTAIPDPSLPSTPPPPHEEHQAMPSSDIKEPIVEVIRVEQEEEGREEHVV